MRLCVWYNPLMRLFENPPTNEEANEERATLERWAAELEKRLSSGSAHVTLANDHTILELTLRDNGPYIRIVSGGPGRSKRLPFTMYRGASKDVMYSHDDRPTSRLTKADVDKMFSNILSNIESFHEGFFGASKI